MPAELGKAVLDLVVNKGGLKKGIDQAKGDVNKSLGIMKVAGAAAFAGLGLAAVSFGKQVLLTGANFETGMNRVKAVSGATGDQFEALRAQAKELGATTQFSATEAADAMGFLAQAGFNADQVLGAMPGTLQLAAAAQIDLATTADIASNVLSGYGLEVKELNHVNDVLVATMTKTNTDLLQLGEAMKYAGPVAAAAGVSFESASAAIGLMGNAGIQGSMAGTSLRGAISRMIAPTDAASDAMKKAGLNFTDAAGRLIPLDEVVQQLEPHAEDVGLMMELFGQRAGPAMAALVSQGADALTDLEGELENSGGTAERIADVQMQGLNGALKALSSAFEGLQIAIAEAGLLELAAALVTGLASLLRVLAKVATAILGPIARALKYLGGQLLAKAREDFARLAKGVGWLWDQMKKFFGWLGFEGKSEVEEGTEAVKGLEDQAESLKVAIPPVVKAVKSVTESVQEQADVIEATKPKRFDLYRELKDIERAETEAKAKLDDFTKAVHADLVAAISAAEPPLIDMSANTAALNTRFETVTNTLQVSTGPAIETFAEASTDSIRSMAESIDSEITKLSGDMVEGLLKGDLSFGKEAPKRFKALGLSFVNDFVGKATTAISGFVKNVLKDQLLGSLGQIGGKISGLFGVGASAVSTGGDIAGAVGGGAQVGGEIAGLAGAGGKAAGGIGKALGAGGGLIGIVGAIGSVATAISGFIQNFQTRTTNDRLYTIAGNQVTMTDYFQDIIDNTDGILQYTVRWYGAWDNWALNLMHPAVSGTLRETKLLVVASGKRDAILERIEALEKNQLTKLGVIAEHVKNPPKIVIREDADRFGERVSEAIRLNRGDARDAVEDSSRSGVTRP